MLRQLIETVNGDVVRRLVSFALDEAQLAAVVVRWMQIPGGWKDGFLEGKRFRNLLIDLCVFSLCLTQIVLGL